MAKTWEEVRDLFRSWREENARRSEEVIDLWECVLRSKAHKLGSEVWLVYEQVCIASYDRSRLDIAQECWDALNEEFPDSLRVRTLRAMWLEVLKKFDDALMVYDRILEKDETNMLSRKRKIAILKAQQRIPEAIKEITEYLKKFMSDQETWMELCELYIQEQDYAKAAFCMEELIVFNPHNHLYHQRYAEIRYSQGGIENIELARSYFAHALKLHPSNMRALYGLFLSATNIASSSKLSQKKRENIKYAAWAAKQIAERYQKVRVRDESHMQTLEAMIETLQLTP